MNSELHLTKQNVAQRLIVASVRMYQQGYDVIAIHCVATSAVNMLRELVAARGQNYGSRVFGAAVYENALARIEQREPIAELPDIPEVNRVVDFVGAEILEGRIKSADDVEVEMPNQTERQALDHIIAPFNYLKHADRDSEATIVESRFDPIKAIAHAVTCYTILFPADLIPDEVRSFVEEHILDIK